MKTPVKQWWKIRALEKTGEKSYEVLLKKTPKKQKTGAFTF